MKTVYMVTQFLPKAAQDWVSDRIHDARCALIDNGLLARPPTDTSESAALKSARAALATAEGDLLSAKTQIENLEKSLAENFGPLDVFRPLKDTCVSRDFGEYTYEFCFWGSATQISRKDSGRTSLGGFQRIAEADDGSSRNEAGSALTVGWEESHEEPVCGVVLKHENGAQCWNGPKRSANVELYCSAVNEIRSVSETEKCVYRFEVGTPAVCGAEGISDAEAAKVRDEL